MGRSSLMLPLLCAAVFNAYASPYSKIPDSIQLGDSFTSQKASLSAQSASFSHANQGKVAVDGIENGRAFVGTKTSAFSNNGVSRSQSSRYSSASVHSGIPIGLVSGSALTSNGQLGYGMGATIASHQGDARSAGASQYWWMAPGSPFLRDNNKPSAGCSPNGCQVVTVLGASQGHQGGAYARNEAARSNIETHVNPFLGTVVNAANSGASSRHAANSASQASFGSAANHASANLASANHASANLASANHASANLASANLASANLAAANLASANLASAKLASANLAAANLASANLASAASFDSLRGGSTIIDASRNPFLNGAIAVGGSHFGYGASADTRNSIESAMRASLNSVSAAAAQQLQSVSQTRENAKDEQHRAGGAASYGYQNAYQTTKEERKEAHAGVLCAGENRICVQKNLCSAEGYVIGNGIIQVRSAQQVCDVENQVCCTLTQSKEQRGGGIFSSGSADERLVEVSDSLSGFTNEVASSNGYLPPIGSEPSSNVPAFTNPPKNEEPDKSGGSSSPDATRVVPAAPAPPPQVGCAAALLCVEDRFCTLEGVITTSPVSYTSEQLLRGVPLSTCRNPETGVVGKCCRDPNYVDPWPAGNLPANYSGGFDEQGFPTILNLSKNRPAKTRPFTGGAVQSPTPIKTSFTGGAVQSPVGIKTSFAGGAVQSPVGIKTSFASGAVQSPAGIKTSFAGANFPSATVTRPVQQLVQAPYQGAVKSPVPFVPTIKTSNPAIKINYDGSSSNENPTVLVQQRPVGRCGLRNLVQRPEGLSDVDVAFGEIPWQAMVLSTADRKLLCSGVIVAPNAIVTAASCVQGLSPAAVAVKTGEWKLGYELVHEEPLPFEIIDVASIVSHPGFTPSIGANDIAILFLEREAKFDRHVDSICLAESQLASSQYGRSCIATGWGKVVLQVNVAGALMHAVDVDVLDAQQCLQRISGAESQIPLHETLFCAKAQKQNNNMCQVDFGGPLACQRSDGSYELVGIYTRDTGCLPTNQVATFAKIPTRWIQETIANPPRHNTNEHRSPIGAVQTGFVHNHGPNEPCNCHELLASGSAQYLPPV